METKAAELMATYQSRAFVSSLVARTKLHRDFIMTCTSSSFIRKKVQRLLRKSDSGDSNRFSPTLGFSHLHNDGSLNVSPNFERALSRFNIYEFKLKSRFEDTITSGSDPSIASYFSFLHASSLQEHLCLENALLKCLCEHF